MNKKVVILLIAGVLLIMIVLLFRNNMSKAVGFSALAVGLSLACLAPFFEDGEKDK